MKPSIQRNAVARILLTLIPNARLSMTRDGMYIVSYPAGRTAYYEARGLLAKKFDGAEQSWVESFHGRKGFNATVWTVDGVRMYLKESPRGGSNYVEVL